MARGLNTLIGKCGVISLQPLRKWIVVSTLLALSASLFTGGALAQEVDVYKDARESTVFIMQAYEESGSQAMSCVGSGTIIDSDGLILTNAHLAEPLGPCQGERVIISLPIKEDAAPIPTYIAEPIQIDTKLDVAILQITSSLDGRPIETGSLTLPAVSVGDPSDLLPGNGLTYVGYEDIGATRVSTVPGVITGITSETAGSRLAWFRTDSVLAGSMSGGGAYDSEGRLVGLLTSAPATTGEDAGPMCLSIQDNTHDGLITDLDACVPVGGTITTIRPIVHARSLIEAATGSYTLDHMAGLPESPIIYAPTITRMYFSSQVSQYGLPTHIVTSLPTGATSLFVFFEYENMVTGLPYELRVTVDGLELPQFSLGPLAWGGGESGTWYIGTEGKTWPDGQYEFTLLLNNSPIASEQLTIGAAPGEQSFSDLVFGIPDESGALITKGTLLPSGISQFDAQFNFSGMQEEQDWTEIWTLDGTEVFRSTYLWSRGESGAMSVSAINVEGLPMGQYHLDLLIGERLAATGEVTLAGNPTANGGSAVFYNNRVASAISRDGQPDGYIGTSGITVPVGVSSLYTFVDWDYMPTGTEWTYRWFLDGRLIGARTQTWNAGGVGQDFWMSLASETPLPEGQYAVEVLVGNQPMFSSNVAVGSGTQPLSGVDTESDEVMISGVVADAVTGEGIAGALVIVLDVALESPDFTWNEAEIYTQALTDRNGRFNLPRGLPRRNYYTVYVFAEGYITVLEDNFTVLSTQPSPSEITIQMSRP